MVQLLGGSLEGAQKLNSESPYNPAIPLLGVYLTTWFHCVLTATTTGAVALGKLLTFSGPRSPIYKMGIIIASADQAVRRIQRHASPRLAHSRRCYYVLA